MLPLIAGIVSSLISNNLPGVAQKVLDNGLEFVEDKLGMKLKPDMSPEEIQKVSEAAMKHEEFLISEGYKDVADARDMQKEALKQEDVWSKRFLPILTITLVILASLFIGFVSFGTFPSANLQMINGIIEFVKITFATIIGFWYGSSNGSVRKTDLLKNEK